MLTLLQIQEDFFATIFNQQNSCKRFNIYHTTIREKLRNSLALTFPGIWILLGKQCADSLAYIFLKNPDNLPKTGNLYHWGEGFIDFLAMQSPLQHLPYLKDYAMYEWLMHLAYGALDSTSLSVHDLEKIPADIIPDISFKFIPSLYLYTARFPIDQIQNMIEHPDAPKINLGQLTTSVVIARPVYQIMTLFVSNDMGLFFKYLKQGQTLGQAMQHTIVEYSDFNLSMALQLLLAHSLIQALTK